MAARGAVVLAALTLLLHVAQADYYPTEGCFWTGNCVNGWTGGCGGDRVVVAKSENCRGLCPFPKYQPCPMFTTHFQCCNQNKPVVGDSCTHCKHRADFGRAYLCCNDCTAPTITDKTTGAGFCMSGAPLVLTLKPLEAYKWTASVWGNCSAWCGGGARSRQVACHKVSGKDENSIGVEEEDSHCADKPMPSKAEGCNLNPCPVDKRRAPKAAAATRARKVKHGTSGWLIALFTLLGLAALAAAAVGGYILYQRSQEKAGGFVYVMLEGYN